jgi:pilus assembly protein CpaF
VQVSEVLGMEGETILMQDIFMFEQSGANEDGEIIGELRASGLRPRCNDKIQEAGITLPANIFGGDNQNLWR